MMHWLRIACCVALFGHNDQTASGELSIEPIVELSSEMPIESMGDPTAVDPKTRSPTALPTASGSTTTDHFVIFNVTGTFSDVVEYCNAQQFGLANIYDLMENELILHQVALHNIPGAFIEYSKNELEWKCRSNVTFDAHQWLSSPLSSITSKCSNIEYPSAGCILLSSYGWKYSVSDQFLVCTRT